MPDKNLKSQLADVSGADEEDISHLSCQMLEVMLEVSDD